MLGLKIQTPAPPEFRPAACAGSAWRVLPARAPCVCGLNDELRVPGSCESECGLGLGVAGACVEFPLSRELPLPRSLLPPLPSKFGGPPRRGRLGGARLGGLARASEAIPGRRRPTYPGRRASSGGGGSDCPRLGSGAGSIRSQLCPP